MDANDYEVCVETHLRFIYLAFMAVDLAFAVSVEEQAKDLVFVSDDGNQVTRLHYVNLGVLHAVETMKPQHAVVLFGHAINGADFRVADLRKAV